jgi:S-adenosylmethionine:tRNA ribosyltransferase-isomerase
MHQPGESHFELLRAFSTDATLEAAIEDATQAGYRGHEFGDCMLLHGEPRDRFD